MPRVAFLGPEGSHTGEAVSACAAVAGWTRLPESGIRAAFAKLVAGEAEAALLPLENALEGSVGATLDLLAGPTGDGIRIRRELVRPIAHALLAPPGLPAEDDAFRASVAAILSHPQALAQCASTISSLFPAAMQIPALSTAEAAKRVAETARQGTALTGTEGSAGAWVAVAPREAAGRFGLVVRRDDLSDEPGNATRFVLLARDDERPTGRDRTSIVFGLDRDRPGGLHDALGEFAARGINLSRIESRPTRRRLGEYWFFVDLEAHREESNAAEALARLERKAGFYRLLGSYPRA